MLRAILRIFTGGLLDKLADAYKAREEAKTDAERIAADVEIARLQERQANRALGGRITAWVQAAWAAPFIIYDWKLLVWDKVLGAGVTDDLSADLMTMQLRIAMFYFGGAAAVGVVRALKR